MNGINQNLFSKVSELTGKSLLQSEMQDLIDAINDDKLLLEYEYKEALDNRYEAVYTQLTNSNAKAVTPYLFNHESFIRVVMYDGLDKDIIIESISDVAGNCEFIPTDQNDEIIFRLT